MIDTKLILIEGIPGAGKSTIAENLFNEIEDHGRECRYFLEWDDDHPIYIGEEDDIPEIIASSRKCAGSVLNQWKEFVSSAVSEESITVIESRFWQTSVMFMYGAGAPEHEVLDANRLVSMAIAELKPVLIYLTFDDVMEALMYTMDLRGAEWEGRITSALEYQELARAWDLQGRELWSKFFSVWMPTAEKLYDDFAYPKTQIHEPHSDWDLAMKEILKFLEL